MQKKTGIILLPGGGMSAWVWESITGGLVLPALCISERIAVNDFQSRKTSSLSDCVEHILQTVVGSGYEDFFIVAHSGAGAIAAKLAMRIPEQVRHVIYIAANLPAHGRTMVSSLPFFIKVMNMLVVRKMIRRDSVPYRGMEKVIRRKFCNDSPEGVIELILSKEMKTEPLCVVTESMNWENFPEIDQTYILLTRDNTLSVSRQREMAENLGIKNIVELASDHMVMLSHPAELAAEINGIIQQSMLEPDEGYNP